MYYNVKFMNIYKCVKKKLGHYSTVEEQVHMIDIKKYDLKLNIYNWYCKH